MRPVAAGIGLTLLLVACGTDARPSGSFSSLEPSTRPSASAPSAEPSVGGTLASPDRPYVADDLLAAMRDSRRPGGVPDELETDTVAGAVAEMLWTWDGAPWEILAVSGACGPETCSLDVAGATAGGGTDLYSFGVDAASGAVELLGTDLHGHPPALDAELDAAARAALDAEDLDGLALVGARWLPPPETDRYWLAYRSGGEVGAPGLEVLIDLASGEVLRAEEAG
jgi:hypothetical protein